MNLRNDKSGAGTECSLNLKKAFFIVFALALASSSVAVILMPFTSWPALTANSPDIIIAKCIKTSDQAIIADGLVWSDIEVESVLKGHTLQGLARMVSQFPSRQEDRYLIFATYQTNQFYHGYYATEKYRVVAINPYFATNQLSGKPLDEQIRLILNSRLEDLKKEMQRAEEEKKRLEEGWKE